MFQFKGIRYKYVGFPNDLLLVPRIFTKVMKPVLSYQVNDFFLVADISEECKDAVIDTYDLHVKLGFLYI